MQATSRSFLISLLIAGMVPALAQSAAPLEESSGSAAKLGYPTVAAALEGLKSKPGVSVNITKPDAWTIVMEPSTKAIWSFTPEGHYAYPSVVRREVKQREAGDVYLEMVALCQAEKEPCDRLIREFQQLNERMRASIQRSAASGPRQ